MADPSVFPPGTSETARLIRAHDWSGTSLGSIDRWPQSLRVVVATMVLSPIPIAVMWGDDGVLLYNDAYAAFAGARHPQVLGRPVGEAWPEVRDFTDHLLQVARAGGTVTYRDYELVLERSGAPESVWVNLDYSPILDESGAPVGGIAMLTDATGKVLAERKLAAERDRLRDMFEEAPGFIAIMEGPEHVFTLINRAYTRLMGPRDVVGRAVRDAVPEAIGQGLVAALDEAYRSGKPFVADDFKFAIPGRDGALEDHYLDFVYQPVRDEAGSVSGIFAQGSDVTERVIAERRLRESQEEYRRLNEGLILANDILALATSHARPAPPGPEPRGE